MAERATRAEIVIIEDDQGIARFLKDLLELEGYRAAMYADGAALDLVAATEPRLIFLDLMLPPPGGAEICRRLRADPRTRATPIVIMTAAAPLTIEQQLHGCDYDGLLRKPFDIDEVLGIASRSIRARVAPSLLNDAALGECDA